MEDVARAIRGGIMLAWFVGIMFTAGYAGNSFFPEDLSFWDGILAGAAFCFIWPTVLGLKLGGLIG